MIFKNHRTSMIFKNHRTLMIFKNHRTSMILKIIELRWFFLMNPSWGKIIDSWWFSKITWVQWFFLRGSIEINDRWFFSMEPRSLKSSNFDDNSLENLFSHLIGCWAAGLLICCSATLLGPDHLCRYTAIVKYILLHKSPLQTNIIIYLGKVGAIRQGFKKGI